mmetsp:Transcript_2461/g.4763  ORF Transcript_2461/g.4763 Transcript_2461/m.4763 type:complete len:97 (+) Transcript_2461:23-313(+)
MGASCMSLFEDFNKDDNDDLLLTEQEKREIALSQRQKNRLMREGQKGFEKIHRNIRTNSTIDGEENQAGEQITKCPPDFSNPDLFTYTSNTTVDIA